MAPDRPHVREQVEGLPEGDVDAPVAGAPDLRLERALEPDARAADRGEERLGDRGPRLLEGRLAGLLYVPGDAPARRVDHLDRCVDHLGADAVPGDQGGGARRSRTRPRLHGMPSTLWSCGRTRTSGWTRLASACRRSSVPPPMVRRGVVGSVSGVRKSGAPGAASPTSRAPRSTSSGAVPSSTGIFTYTSRPAATAIRKQASCSSQRARSPVLLGHFTSKLTIATRDSTRARRAGRMPAVSSRTGSVPVRRASQAARKSACASGSPPVTAIACSGGAPPAGG